MLPCRALCGVAQEIHDDGALLDGLVDIEQVCAGDPTILLRLFPACAVFPDTNNHVESIVAQVQTLTMTLRAVTDESEGVIFEVFLR